MTANYKKFEDTKTYLEDFKISRQTSIDVMEYFASKTNLPIVDLYDDMEAQRNGIDFRVGDKTVEFKCDFNMCRTGNIALEIIANVERRKIGCILNSQAYYLVYYDLVNHIIYMFNLSQLIKEVMVTGNKVGKYALGLNGGVKQYAGISVLVPINELEKLAEKIDYRKYNITTFLEHKALDKENAWTKTQALTS